VSAAEQQMVINEAGYFAADLKSVFKGTL